MGAPVKPTSKPIKGFEVMEWTLKAGDVGDWVDVRSAIPSVQMAGDFGVDAVCAIEGTNNQDHDPVGLHSSREPTIDALSPLVRYVRPVVTGGDAKTNITITMMVPQ